jgi:hypothetical protein
MDTPRVLLEHYLKQLRLPTMVREYPKLAEQCAKEGATGRRKRSKRVRRQRQPSSFHQRSAKSVLMHGNVWRTRHASGGLNSGRRRPKQQKHRLSEVWVVLSRISVTSQWNWCEQLSAEAFLQSRPLLPSRQPSAKAKLRLRQRMAGLV